MKSSVILTSYAEYHCWLGGVSLTCAFPVFSASGSSALSGCNSFICLPTDYLSCVYLLCTGEETLLVEKKP